MAKSNDQFDFLDELFEELETSGAQSVNDFGDMIKRRVSDEMKKNGYDDFSDMVLGGIGDNSNGKARSRAYVRNTNSRCDYFISALDSVTYGYQYRGYYKEAHQDALDKYIQMAKENSYDLSVLERNVAQEIRLVRRNRKGNTDKEYQGYLDGLNLVKKELENSKIYLMGKIAESIGM